MSDMTWMQENYTLLQNNNNIYKVNCPPSSMSGDTCLGNVVTEKTDLVIMRPGSAYLYSAGLISFTHY